MVTFRAGNQGVRTHQRAASSGGGTPGFTPPHGTFGVDYNDDPALGGVGYRPQRGPGNVQASTYVNSLERRNASVTPQQLQQNYMYNQQQRQQQSAASYAGALAQSQLGPQMAGLGMADALLRQSLGLNNADLQSTLDFLNQQQGLSDQGTAITLADINRRRGFAGRDKGISMEDINARRGFAGRDRDLVRQLIDTERGRLGTDYRMDNVNLNSEYTPRGAFTSNMANAKRGFLTDMLDYNMADQDTRWSQNDLSFDQAMRGLLTEEQRAALGYDVDMSGLLTQEQRAKLERSGNNLGTNRQRDQAVTDNARRTIQTYMDMAGNDQERMNIMSSMTGWLTQQGLTSQQIQDIMGPYMPKKQNNNTTRNRYQ